MKSEVDKLTRQCNFKCFQCGLVDHIEMRGSAFTVIDFFGKLIDRFYNAMKTPTPTVEPLEELPQQQQQTQPLITTLNLFSLGEQDVGN